MNSASGARPSQIPALRVTGLSVGITTSDSREVPLLKNISFHLMSGQVTGVLGESGAGKSTLAMALLHLLPPRFRMQAGCLELRGKQLLTLTERQWRSVRGARLSLVHQDVGCLNPVMRCREQVVEVLRAHGRGTMRECRDEARELLRSVGLGDERFCRSYPHQLSGGQKQRVLIAQAIACRPDVIIADEPTASLDTRCAQEIMFLLRELTVELNAALLLITHQPVIVAHFADDAFVLHKGEIIEHGSVSDLLNQPMHPYTRQLLACRQPLNPDPLAGNTKGDRLKPRWPTINQDLAATNPLPVAVLSHTSGSERAQICAITNRPIEFADPDEIPQVESIRERR